MIIFYFTHFYEMIEIENNKTNGIKVYVNVKSKRNKTWSKMFKLKKYSNRNA